MVRVGLVGCGIWGSKILDRLGAMGVEVVVADPDADRGDVADAAQLPTVDALIVATPATTHAAVLDGVAGRDVPVFCEKPFTTDVADARRLAAVFGDRLHLMHTWRYHPGVEALGEIARSGRLGAINGIRSTRANWTSPRTDTDAVWTLAPHDVTLAIEILGAVPAPRSAVAERLGGRAVGLWATLGGDDEPWLVVEASTRFADKRREIRVHGTDGVAVLANLDDAFVEIASGTELEPAIERVPIPDGEPLVRQLEAFLGHVAGGPPPKSDAAEGVLVVETVAELRHLAGL